MKSSESGMSVNDEKPEKLLVEMLDGTQLELDCPKPENDFLSTKAILREQLMRFGGSELERR